MKKRILLFISAVLCLSQLSAQTKVELIKTGFVKKTGNFVESVIETKGRSSTYCRIAFVEVPIGVSVANKVDLNLYFYYSDNPGDFTIEYATRNGAIPDGITYANQPTDFTVATTATVNKESYGWVAADITEQYNAAVLSEQSSMTVRVISDSEQALNKFYSLNTGTANKPHLMVTSDCAPEFNTYEKTLVKGTSITIDGEEVTETGTYTETSSTECGETRTDTYHVMFITDGEVANPMAMCEGGAVQVQIGPNRFKTYTEEGEYSDVVESDDKTATMTIKTTVTIAANPEANDISLIDETIREGEVLTIDAGEGFASYKWYNKTSDAAPQLIAGETGRYLEVTNAKSAFKIGLNEIFVQVTNEAGCESPMTDFGAWVTIEGNLVFVTKDVYIQEADGRMIEDAQRLEVKYDTWGSTTNEAPAAPYYTKEIFMSYDLSDVDIPEEAKNFKLRMYFYGFTINPKQPTDNPELLIHCDYIDYTFPDDMNWETRPQGDNKTQLASSLLITETDKDKAVTWNINEVFVNDILGSLDQFSIILSAPRDTYSLLAKFKDDLNVKDELRPAITFELEVESGIDGTTTTLEVVLAPNPVVDIMYINSSEKFETAEIYNMQGQQVSSSIITDNIVDLRELVRGQYIVSLVKGEKRYSQIVIKK